MTHPHTLSHLAVAAIASLVLTTATAHAAPLSNGTFDNGLTGWSTLGDASVQTGSIQGLNLAGPTLVLGTATLLGGDDAPDLAGSRNVSGVAASGVAVLENAMGQGAGALYDADLDLSAYEGSLASQTFVVQAGQKLSFEWRLLSRDNGNSYLADAAWLSWQQSGNNALLKLGDTATLPLVNTTGGWLDSGTRMGSFIASASGTVTLGFVVADVNSTDTTSLLAIRNVQLSPIPAVPEPQSIALVLAGLALVGARGILRGNRS